MKNTAYNKLNSVQGISYLEMLTALKTGKIKNTPLSSDQIYRIRCKVNTIQRNRKKNAVARHSRKYNARRRKIHGAQG